MSKKTCKMDDCNNPVFGRGYCHYHYRSEYLAKKPISKATERRKAQIVDYNKKRRLFIEGQRDSKGKLFCLFCGKEIHGEPSLHHALGRDDELLIDTRFWMLSHNYCHVHQYHSMSWKDIPWWDRYMERLVNWIKDSDQLQVLNKEKLRMSKT